LQAAVHSIYRRLGSGLAATLRCGATSSFCKGNFNGQSPQKLEPP